MSEPRTQSEEQPPDDRRASTATAEGDDPRAALVRVLRAKLRRRFRECPLVEPPRDPHLFEVPESDRQAIVLALAQLRFSRPGWKEYLRIIAERFSGGKLWDELVDFGPDERPEQEGSPSEPTLAKVLRVVTTHFDVTAEALLSRDRTNSVNHPRHVGMYLAREATRRSLAEVGEFFGGRGHSAVVYAVEQVADKMLCDDEFLRTVESLLERVLSGAGSWPPRFRFQVNGVCALWGRKHKLQIGMDAINELIACLGLDPRAEVEFTPKVGPPGD